MLWPILVYLLPGQAWDIYPVTLRKPDSGRKVELESSNLVERLLTLASLIRGFGRDQANSRLVMALTGWWHLMASPDGPVRRTALQTSC
jgi:hypothetical protein